MRACSNFQNVGLLPLVINWQSIELVAGLEFDMKIELTESDVSSRCWYHCQRQKSAHSLIPKLIQ